MNHDDFNVDYGLFILWTFRDALEHPSDTPPHGSGGWAMDCFVPAAAKLIEIAGPKISGWHHEYEYGPRVMMDPGKGGPLWNGSHGFCRERWTFWRKRFFELARETRWVVP